VFVEKILSMQFVPSLAPKEIRENTLALVLEYRRIQIQRIGKP
jgi:hypothetical protein